MNLVFSCFFLLLHLCLFSQTRVTGSVVDSSSNQPIAGASIYFDNTQTGSITNSEGTFSLMSPSDAMQPLIISHIGYKTVVVDIAKNNLSHTILNVKMTKEATGLENVTITNEQLIPVSSKKWKTLFLEYFIGNDTYAENCKILNPDQLSLYLSKNEDVLKARSSETIVIENAWLGYKIFYEIELCEINLKNRSLVNYGHVRFEDLSDGSQLFNLRRIEQYCGSFNHFLKSLYRGALLPNGFEVKKARIGKNTEKERVKELMKKHSYQVNFSFETIGSKRVPDDTAKYYYQVYIAKNENSIIADPTLLNADDLLITDVPLSKELFFTDHLLVSYKNRNAAPSLHNMAPELALINKYENSLLKLREGHRARLYPSGRFDPPKSIIVAGNWAHSNTISRLMPQEFDYDCK